MNPDLSKIMVLVISKDCKTNRKWEMFCPRETGPSNWKPFFLFSTFSILLWKHNIDYSHICKFALYQSYCFSYIGEISQVSFWESSMRYAQLGHFKIITIAYLIETRWSHIIKEKNNTKSEKFLFNQVEDENKEVKTCKLLFKT